MELTTALIWTLRIVLPIILFCIYFKFQSSKDDQVLLGSSTGGKSKYPIRKLLAHRQAVAADEVPPELASLALKSQSQAPELFQGGERAGKGKGGGKKGREPREDRPEKGGKDRERRSAKDQEKTEKTERPKSSSKEREKDAKDAKDARAPAPELVAAALKAEEVPTELGPSARGALQLKESEEKMNLESFLNYVAFNKKTQASVPEVLDLSEASADRANAEAQMVLRGSMGFKRVDVAKDLYGQLAAASVDIFATTYTLMIEACVVARDLKSASDFLMKMEASGHSPNSDLLDKVLDLYSNQKTHRASKVEKAAKEEDGLDDEIETEAIDLTRAKLKSDAPIFVPSFGIPPPPPKPRPVDLHEGETAVTDSQQAPTDSRTRLTAAAKPFEPQTQWPADAGPPAPETTPNKSNKNEGREGKQHWSKSGKRGSEEGRKMWKPKEPAATERPEGQ